jgi:hypothetical protein
MLLYDVFFRSRLLSPFSHEEGVAFYTSETINPQRKKKKTKTKREWVANELPRSRIYSIKKKGCNGRMPEE